MPRRPGSRAPRPARAAGRRRRVPRRPAVRCRASGVASRPAPGPRDPRPGRPPGCRPTQRHPQTGCQRRSGRNVRSLRPRSPGRVRGGAPGPRRRWGRVDRGCRRTPRPRPVRGSGPGSAGPPHRCRPSCDPRSNRASPPAPGLRWDARRPRRCRRRTPAPRQSPPGCSPGRTISLRGGRRRTGRDRSCRRDTWADPPAPAAWCRRRPPPRRCRCRQRPRQRGRRFRWQQGRTRRGRPRWRRPAGAGARSRGHSSSSAADQPGWGRACLTHSVGSSPLSRSSNLNSTSMA